MRVGTRRGFTLIELLVVIAIISILASILFPVFSRARAKGRATACLSNESQILKAIMMYTQDYDETFPIVQGLGSGHYVTTPSATGYQWYDAIHEYTRNWDILICPEIKTIIPGYGMNYLLNCESVGSMYDPVKKVTIIDFCPGTPSQHHEAAVNVTGQGIADPFLDNDYAKRHNGGYNVGFGDGHVKFQTPSSLQPSVHWNPYEQS